QTAMQLLVDGINPVEARQGGGGVLLPARLFEERSQPLDQAWRAAADPGVPLELLDGVRLIVLGQVGLGEQLVSAAGLDIVGVQVPDGGGFPEYVVRRYRT